MKRRIIQEFLNHRYACEDDIKNPQILYKIMDEGIYIVSIYDVPNDLEKPESLNSIILHENIQRYQDYIRKIKWDFINKGYRNIQVLHVILSEVIEVAKSYLSDSDCYWIVNKVENKLIIYENQKAQFLDARDCIEGVINGNEQTVSVKDIISNTKRRLKANNNIVSMVITLSIIVINNIVFLIMDWSVDGRIYNTFIENGGISFQTAIVKHQYYRFITSMFIHSDISHIFGNMIVLFFIGREIEKRLGSGRYLLLYFIGGIVADCTSLGYNKMYDKVTLSIGASGAIFAVVGAMIAILVINRDEFKEIGIQRLIFFVIITMYNGITTTGIDNAAHIGGLISGAIIGYCLYKNKYRRNK